MKASTTDLKEVLVRGYELGLHHTIDRQNGTLPWRPLSFTSQSERERQYGKLAYPPITALHLSHTKHHIFSATHFSAATQAAEYLDGHFSRSIGLFTYKTTGGFAVASASPPLQHHEHFIPTPSLLRDMDTLQHWPYRPILSRTSSLDNVSTRQLPSTPLWS